SGFGWWPALAVSVVVAAVLGLGCDLLIRGLREQIVPALVALVGCSALLLAGINAVWGSGAKFLPPAWAGPSFTLGDFSVARSRPWAAVAGVVLGLVPTLIESKPGGASGVGGIGNLVAFLIVAGVLLRRPGLIGRPALDEAFSSAAADSAPSTARRRAALTAGPVSLPAWVRRVGLAALALGLAVGVPALSSAVGVDAW